LPCGVLVPGGVTDLADVDGGHQYEPPGLWKGEFFHGPGKSIVFRAPLVMGVLPGLIEGLILGAVGRLAGIHEAYVGCLHRWFCASLVQAGAGEVDFCRAGDGADPALGSESTGFVKKLLIPVLDE
jgi:hypothetical protein